MSPFGNGKCVKYDNGTEYTSVEFENILHGNKVKHPFSSPYSTHQNGTADRGWRNFFKANRCVLLKLIYLKIDGTK